MNALQSIWTSIQSVISGLNFPTDVLDILIVAFLIYKVLNVSRSRSAGQIIKAVVALLVLSYVSSLLRLNALNYVISRVIEIGLIALVVVFQPELRRTMERLGGSTIRDLFLPRPQSADSVRTVGEVVSACRSMSRQKIGALIVFERENSLEEYFKTGTVINADVSEELLKNIFFPKAALHDGAVVIRSDRIADAGCVLPLTENPNLSRELGTRHRAAIGISEHSDAVVVVVSEETGVISCVTGGNLRRYMTPETLNKYLTENLVEEEQKPVHHRLRERLANLVRREDEENHAEK